MLREVKVGTAVYTLYLLETKRHPELYVGSGSLFDILFHVR